MKKLYIIIGISGSGKTYLAKKLYENDPENTAVFSTDTIFYDSNGKYFWFADGLSAAHLLNKQKTEEACRQGVKNIIIDNTNLTNWEREPYEHLAKQYGYQIEYSEPKTEWKNDPKKCAEKSKHLNDSLITTRQLYKKEMPNK